MAERGWVSSESEGVTIINARLKPEIPAVDDREPAHVDEKPDEAAKAYQVYVKV